MQLITYLGFNGQCQEAFKFYEQCLGGKIGFMMTYGDSERMAAERGGAAGHTAPEQKDRIMHARLDVGGAVLMGGDTPQGHWEAPLGFCVSIQIDDPAQAERIFNALADGGQVQMPIGETFWALRFGMLIDRFGTPWMVNCEKAA
jgi:PhnB protein